MGFLALMWCKRKNPQTSHNHQKNKQELRQNATSTFKKKKNKEKGNCYICDKHGHWVSECEDCKLKLNRKSEYMVLVRLKEEHLNAWHHETFQFLKRIAAK